MADKKELEYQRLRSFLNPAMRGSNVDSVLRALAEASSPALLDNISAICDSMYISTASEKYLDQRLADYNLSRPPEVGIGDDVFRNIGISVVNKKQIRSLIEELLTVIFGDEATHAIEKSPSFEPYALVDGDTLIVAFDGKPPSTITFATADFTDITNATAQEVADAISKSLRNQGLGGGAFAQNDGSGFYVSLKSDTAGPQSTVTVKGGRAQNVLKFPAARPVVGSATTEWTITQEAGSVTRYTWTNGPDPSLGKARVGDYVNIYGANFNVANRGTYDITAVHGGVAGDAYFEVENPNTVPQVVLQGSADGLIIFFPEKILVTSKPRWSAVYQTQPRLLEVFIPATTKVVRRDRIGAMHIHADTDGSADINQDYGPYIFDEEQPFTISSVGSVTTTAAGPTTGRIINIAAASTFPDEPGHLILGYGTSRQEGPLPYIARPSATSLLVNPAYIVSKRHPVGEDVALVSSLAAANLSPTGEDHQAYITDEVSGRLYAEDLINTVVATGINVVITVLYPGSIGLSKWGTVYDDKVYVWGI